MEHQGSWFVCSFKCFVTYIRCYVPTNLLSYDVNERHYTYKAVQSYALSAQLVREFIGHVTFFALICHLCCKDLQMLFRRNKRVSDSIGNSCFFYERKRDSEKRRFPNYSQTVSRNSCNLYHVHVIHRNGDRRAQYRHV